MNDIGLDRRGADHAVLLIHGLMGNPLEMQYLARQLRRDGFATFVPHLRGYGYGPRGAAPERRWAHWRAQLLEHFDQMKNKYSQVSVCGLCVGATLALNLATERGEEISSLSLLATTLAFDGWSIPWYRFLAPLGYYTPLRYLYSYRERDPYGLKNPQLRAWIAREMREKESSAAGASQLPMESVYEAHKLNRHVRRVLPQVRVPTLLMHAREDDVASLENAEFVLKNIGTERKRLVILEDSYHMVTMDNEKRMVAEQTASFFMEYRGVRQ
jgi:carboxylesterase